MAHVKSVVTRQRKDGKLIRKYRVLWREPKRDDFGVQIKGQYRTRSETYGDYDAATARRDELNAARHTTGTSALAEAKKAGQLPFGYYAKAWLDQQAVKVSQGKLKSGTADEYGRLLRCYVLGELGGTAIATITGTRCEQLLAALVQQASTQGNRQPLTPGTVKHAWDVTRRVFKYAVQHKAIPANPCDAVDFSAARATGDRPAFEHRPLTAEQVGALSAAIAGIPPAGYTGPALPAYPVYALMVEFMAYTGLRAAEVSGLEVRDLVFSPGPRCSVNVRRTKGRKGGAWVDGTLKSKRSRRTVPLPDWLAVRMADYLTDVHERADEPTAPLWPSRKNGGGYRATGQRYAVPLDWSQPLALGAFYDTIVKPALEAIGLPASRPARAKTATAPARPAQRGVRLHDLRHTFAVLQLSAGVHFMQVSKWLGHSTYTLTLDVYGDYIPEQDGGALNTLPAPPAPAKVAKTAGNVVELFG